MLKRLTKNIESTAGKTAMKIIYNMLIKYLKSKNMNNDTKTTVIGALLAIGIAVRPIVLTGIFNIKTQWPALVGAALVALGGYFTNKVNKQPSMID